MPNGDQKPWEKYAATMPAPAAGPWAKYGGAAPPVPDQNKPPLAETPSTWDKIKHFTGLDEGFLFGGSGEAGGIAGGGYRPADVAAPFVMGGAEAGGAALGGALKPAASRILSLFDRELPGTAPKSLAVDTVTGPGAPLPSAGEFYENRAADLMRRGKEQSAIDRLALRTSKPSGKPSLAIPGATSSEFSVGQAQLPPVSEVRETPFPVIESPKPATTEGSILASSGGGSRRGRVILPGERIDPLSVESEGSAARASDKELAFLGEQGDRSAAIQLVNRRKGYLLPGNPRPDFGSMPLPSSGETGPGGYGFVDKRRLAVTPFSEEIAPENAPQAPSLGIPERRTTPFGQYSGPERRSTYEIWKGSTPPSEGEQFGASVAQARTGAPSTITEPELIQYILTDPELAPRAQAANAAGDAKAVDALKIEAQKRLLKPGSSAAQDAGVKSKQRYWEQRRRGENE